MNKKELQKAIECLGIQDVFQRAARSSISDGFDPKYSDENTFGIEFMHIVKRSEVIQLDDNDEHCIFRVHIDLGVRWVGVDRKQDEVETQKLETTETETDVLALIEATYVAEYSLQGEPGKDALDEFALNNASYHVWPYWREYIMSQSMRMNLPKVALPAMQLAANKDDNVDG